MGANNSSESGTGTRRHGRHRSQHRRGGSTRCFHLLSEAGAPSRSPHTESHQYSLQCSSTVVVHDDQFPDVWYFSDKTCTVALRQDCNCYLVQVAGEKVNGHRVFRSGYFDSDSGSSFLNDPSTWHAELVKAHYGKRMETLHGKTVSWLNGWEEEREDDTCVFKVCGVPALPLCWSSMSDWATTLEAIRDLVNNGSFSNFLADMQGRTILMRGGARAQDGISHHSSFQHVAPGRSLHREG